MKGKNLGVALLTTTILFTSSQAYAVDAMGRKTDISLNGEKYSLEAYNIGGNNFFKLRDLAKILNSTDKKFNVSWNQEAKNVEIEPGQDYEALGSELEISQDLKKQEAVRTKSSILYNNEELNLEAYNIRDNNYFKLRDLTERLDIHTGYDNESRTISLDTSKSYEQEKTPDKKPDSSGDLGRIRKDIEAGKYKDHGPTKVLDITHIDLDKNKKPHIAAIVSGGEDNYKLLHLDNTGKFINAEELSIEDRELGMYVVDTYDFDDEEGIRAIEDLYMSYNYGYGISLSAFEYYQGKLVEYKLGDKDYAKPLPMDNYKLRLELETADDEIGLPGLEFIVDVKGQDKIQQKYFDSNGKSLIKSSDDEDNHLHLELEGVEGYRDEKTGQRSLIYTYILKDHVEDIAVTRLRLKHLSMEEGQKLTYLRTVGVEEVDL